MKMLGIDPGHKGSLVLLNERGTVLARHRMPTFKYNLRSGKTRTAVDAVKLTAIIKSMAPDEAWIENVHSQPKDGHVGAFTFGRGFGTLIGVFAALGISARFIEPATWKAAMKVTANKGTSTRRAKQLFPGAEKMLTTADDCEAAMIGLYGLMARQVTALGAARS